MNNINIKLDANLINKIKELRNNEHVKIKCSSCFLLVINKRNNVKEQFYNVF